MRSPSPAAGVRVLHDAAEEQGALQDVPLERLAIAPGIRDALAKLGVHSLGEFLRLPSEGIRRRYGKAAFDLHRMASGELNLPLQPERPVEPVTARLILDRPETDVERLMALIETRLPPLLEALAGRGQVLEELRLLFRFERLGEHKERIRPAAPTLDARQILELIRLRLSAARLPDGVEELHLLSVPSAPSSASSSCSPPGRAATWRRPIVHWRACGPHSASSRWCGHG
jgi:protein ImuB